MKAILIDDHILFSTALQQLLRHGCGIKEVLQSDDALQAIEMIKAERKMGLIITDLDMPVVDGIDFLHALRHHNISIPAAMLTANEEPHKLYQALEAGALGIIPKHSTLPELQLAIKTLRPNYPLVLKYGGIPAEIAQK